MSKRYPIEPLQGLTRLSLAELNRRAGLHRTRTREQGLSAEQADRAAVACNLSPYDVWPEMLDDAIEASSKPCRECATPFVPGRSDQRYCTPSCRWRRGSRENYRRRYQTDPAFAEKQRERSRAYQSDERVAEVKRIKQRIRDRAKVA